MSEEIDPIYSNKWIRKFLRQAREASDGSDCASRGVGCVLVKDKIPISQGFNGPPSGCSNNCARIEFYSPKCYFDHAKRCNISFEKTEPWYDDKTCKIMVPMGIKNEKCCSPIPLTEDPCTQSFLEDFGKGKNICPRKLLGYKSGENLELCSCCHAESNAIAFAARQGHSTILSSCFTFPISPCKMCAGLLISAGIKEIYSVFPYKDSLAKIIFNEAKIRLYLVQSELLDLDAKDKRINTDKFVTQYQ